MPELVLILFKINLVLLLFAAAYHLVLRRLTFYTLNRVFLVGGIIFSTIYPFINLTAQQINPKVTALVPTIDVNSLLKTNSILDYWNLAVAFFYLGVILMSMRLFAQFVSLYRVHKSSIPGSVGNLPVRILKDKLSPFSFWQTVYVNPAIHSSNELETILAHEQIHVKEWHTLDIILAEISVVFYWFNPGVWLMKRAIKENIEFITDARIVKRGVDKKAYQYSLLGVGNLPSSVALVNNFNLSDLKKRIKMMNAKRSSPKKLLIYAFILPVLLITTLAFTISKKEVKKHLMPLSKALSTTTIFEQPLVKNEVQLKVKPKRKDGVVKTAGIKKDSVRTIKYIVNTIILKSDSLDTQHMPEDILAKIEKLRESLKGTVKGINISGTTFFYKFADTLTSDRLDAVDHIRMVNGKQDYPVANSKATIIVKGYPTSPKKRDSLNALNVSYIMNGEPISQEELNKAKAENFKTVVVRKTDKGKAEITITAKKD